MRFNLEDDFIDMGINNDEKINKQAVNENNDLKDFLSLEKVSFQINKYDLFDLSSVICLLPISDGADQYYSMNFSDLKYELCRANEVNLNDDDKIYLATLDSYEIFVIKNEVEYRKLLKVAMRTNNSIRLWLDYIPFESNKLKNINKKFDDLFLKKEPEEKNVESDLSCSSSLTKMCVDSNTTENLSSSLKKNDHESLFSEKSVNQLSFENFLSQHTKINKNLKIASDISSPENKNDNKKFLNSPNIIQSKNINLKRPSSPLDYDNQNTNSFNDIVEISTPLDALPKQQQKNSLTSLYKNLENQTSALDEKMINLSDQIEKIEKRLIEKSYLELKENLSENSSKLIIHPDIYCDSCDKDIVGIRYKCISCDDYDLCEKCETIDDVHISGHNFIKIKTPMEISALSSAFRFKDNQKFHPTNYRYKHKELKQKSNDLSEFVKKKKLKLNKLDMFRDRPSACPIDKSPIIRKLNETSNIMVENFELGKDEKLFDEIKEARDHLLLKIEPFSWKKSTGYINSRKSIPNPLIANALKNQTEMKIKESSKQERKQDQQISKKNINSKKIDITSADFYEKALKPQQENRIARSVMNDEQNFLLKTNIPRKSYLQSKKLLLLTQSEQKCRDFLFKYIKFVLRLSNNKEFLNSNKNFYESEPEKDNQKIIIDQINKAFFDKFLLISNNETPLKQVNKNKVDKISEHDEKELNSYYLLYDLPFFKADYKTKYYSFIDKINLNNDFVNKNQIIEDFKTNLIRKIKEQLLNGGFDFIIQDEAKYDNFVYNLIQKAFEEVVKINKKENDPQNEDTSFQRSSSNYELNKEIENNETSNFNESKSRDTETIVQEISNENKIEKINEISNRIIDLTNYEDKLSEKDINEDLSKYDLASDSSISTKNIDEEFSNSLANKKLTEEHNFFNICLGNMVNDESCCSTPNSSNSSLSSYEIIIPDLLDVEKKNVDLSLKSSYQPDDEKKTQENNESLVTTSFTKSNQKNLEANKVINISSTSNDKSSICSLIDNKSALSDKIQNDEKILPKGTDLLQLESKSSNILNVFDFNNWTYSLRSTDSKFTSRKNTKQMMNEFYEICRNQYGLK